MSSPSSEDEYYREGAIEVGVGRDYAIVDGRKVALTGSDELAEILTATPYIQWKLSLRDDAIGRDLIAALEAGTVAGFQRIDLDGIGEPRIIHIRSRTIPPAIIVNIAKDRVRVTQNGTEVFAIETEDIYLNFEDAFDKICKKSEYKCGRVAVTVDDEATRNPIVAVMAALAPRVATSIGSTVDFVNALESDAKPAEVPPSAEESPRLPPEVIQQIVREHYGTFRTCYEQGLLRDGHLKGRVITKFVIESDGKVRRVESMPRTKRAPGPRPESLDTTMPDREVVDCISKGYKTLEFPQPKGGFVTVVYPIMFSPR